MASNAPKEMAGGRHLDRRIIRVENLPDQAGIAAALRRAFAAGAHEKDDADLMFEELLRRLH
jgi:hypothetical protein